MEFLFNGLTKLLRPLMPKRRKHLKGRPKSKLSKPTKPFKAYRKQQKETKPERNFRDVLNEVNIPFKAQHNVKGFLFDFYIPDENLLIEVDGDYWHGNPEKFPDPSSMQRKNRRRDRLKTKVAREQGYRVVRFWESDINANPSDVKSQLLEQFKNTP
ncbi:MAG: DUF559 domain-containing protein [Bacteroidetes bacterium]|nr:DUF559 domain-containing protein [Bacteroidota bacterium]